jgi:hypothetical protein
VNLPKAQIENYKSILTERYLEDSRKLVLVPVVKFSPGQGLLAAFSPSGHTLCGYYVARNITSGSTTTSNCGPNQARNLAAISWACCASMPCRMVQQSNAKPS